MIRIRPSADWRKIIETAAVRAFNLLAGVLGVIIIARILGPEGQGMVAAAIAWVSLVAAIAGLSLGQVSQYRIQMRRANAWDGTIFGSLLLLWLGLSLIGSIFVIAAGLLTQGQFFGGLPVSLLAIAVILLPMLIWDEYASNLLAGADRIHTYNRILVGGRLFGLLFLFVLVVELGVGANGALSAQVIGQSVIAIGSFIVLWQLHRPAFRVVRAEAFQMIRGAFGLHMNTIGAFVLSQSSVLALNEFTTKTEVGWYHLSWQMVAVPLIVPQAAALMLYAKIAAIGPDRAWPIHKRVMIGVMAFMAVLVAIAYTIGPNIIVYLAGEDFRPSAQLFRILLPALLGMGFVQLMTPQWISRGIFLPTSLVTVATAALHLAVTIPLVRKYGATGAAWATAVTLTLAPMLVQGYFARWCEQRYRRSCVIAQQ